VLFTCTALLLGAAPVSQVEAQGFNGFLFPLFGPSPWSRPYYGPPSWHERYRAPPQHSYDSAARKRRAARIAERKVAQAPRRQTALALVPKSAPVRSIAATPKDKTISTSVTCDKAQAIVAEFGFKNIKAEACEGTILDFSAMRDGKRFVIRIMAANGDLARVQRLR
jgi:hypothetical protein